MKFDQEKMWSSICLCPKPFSIQTKNFPRILYKIFIESICFRGPCYQKWLYSIKVLAKHPISDKNLSHSISFFSDIPVIFCLFHLITLPYIPTPPPFSCCYFQLLLPLIQSLLQFQCLPLPPPPPQPSRTSL